MMEMNSKSLGVKDWVDDVEEYADVVVLVAAATVVADGKLEEWSVVVGRVSLAGTTRDVAKEFRRRSEGVVLAAAGGGGMTSSIE